MSLWKRFRNEKLAKLKWWASQGCNYFEVRVFNILRVISSRPINCMSARVRIDSGGVSARPWLGYPRL
jgi:hypothetical protein